MGCTIVTGSTRTASNTDLKDDCDDDVPRPLLSNHCTGTVSCAGGGLSTGTRGTGTSSAELCAGSGTSIFVSCARSIRSIAASAGNCGKTKIYVAIRDMLQK